ncbi:MAG: redoxin domain-containing protein [Actinomycetota bacterium]
MTTKTFTMPRTPSRKQQARRLAHRRRRHKVWRTRALIVVGLAALGAMFWALGRDGGGSGTIATGEPAPAFSLATTDGRTISLASLQGRNVLLYFNEGVGCDSCFSQLVEIEKSQARLDELGVTLLPFMPNPAPEVRRELARFGLRTPALIDSSLAVARAFDTLGRGHHANLPGHSFILVDQAGTIRWRGDYPSMYVATAELLETIGSRLEG